MTAKAVETKAAPLRFRDTFVTRADIGGNIDPRNILITKGFNVRDYRLPENRAHLDSLKLQIKSYGGVYRPLMVRYDGGQVILVDGESRLTAVLELIHEGMEIKSVPCTDVKTNNEAELLMLSLGANGGKNLSLWELGTGYSRFEKMGWSIEDITNKLGVSDKHVKQAIEAATLPMEAKQLMTERAISPALAITTIRKKGTVAGTAALKDAAAAHKATGKKGPAKAAKAPSKKEVAAGEWEKLARAIFKDLEDDYLECERNKFPDDFLSVRIGFIKKLAKMVHGTKQ